MLKSEGILEESRVGLSLVAIKSPLLTPFEFLQTLRILCFFCFRSPSLANRYGTLYILLLFAMRTIPNLSRICPLPELLGTRMLQHVDGYSCSIALYDNIIS